MKKTIIVFILSIFTILLSFNTSANGTIEANWEEENPIKVTVTENIPWLGCSEKKWSKTWSLLYECKVQKWFGGVVNMLWGIIKYFTFIALLSAVLFLVIWWIIYSMSWADPSSKEKAKEKITQVLLWLIVLLLSWVILTIIAPWKYK